MGRAIVVGGLSAAVSRRYDWDAAAGVIRTILVPKIAILQMVPRLTF